ncbi:hypothetical protein [Mycobacteroides abscessus]|uniref:hypothetical protein n=1 Tax=Mycobacteroides abscessus TaxID=36809 RepID=UPI0018965C3D|nr:hypothetical protein [Mycobacteroides abscessus]
MSDATSPKYYQFGDVQLIAISGKLTGCGAQAVQYVARSTRMDGCNKGQSITAQIEDLRKAKVFIDFEIERLESMPKAIEEISSFDAARWERDRERARSQMGVTSYGR